MENYTFLAFDLGATSGRSVLGTLRDGKIEINELTRFPNAIFALHGKYYWNLAGLYEHIKEGLAECAKRGIKKLKVLYSTEDPITPLEVPQEELPETQ